MGIVCVYLVEILLELTLGPISTHSHEWEMPPFPRAGHILRPEINSSHDVCSIIYSISHKCSVSKI